MRRYRFEGGLGPSFRIKAVGAIRPGSWARTAKAFKAVNLQCAKCGAIAELECDHIVPRHQGGADAWTNLQSLCRACHAAKSATEQGKRPRGGGAAWRDPIG
jgi:5-methylcytosine-specific restriction endonuclease McrA